MHTKKDAAFIITVVLSMLILAFISFISVYEQILSQNNGFFNVIIYGVVLILVFIFITLFSRMLKTKNENKEVSPILNILIFIGIAAIFAVFVILRIRYTSSISPSDSVMYRAAAYINDGLLDQANDIHEHLIGYPADFIYGYFISDFFAITEASEAIYIVINISMMLITALFLFFAVNLISNKACATLAVLALLFMPNNSFLVYSYNSELFVAAVMMISVFLFELLIYKRFKSSSTSRIIALLCGIVSGLLISCEPVCIFAVIILTLWVFRSERQNVFSCVIPIIVSIIEFMGLVFLQSMMMGRDLIDVLMGRLLCFVPNHIRDVDAPEFTLDGMFKGIISRFNNPSRFLNDNSYFLVRDDGKSISASQALGLSCVDQYIFLFMLILCVLCVVYILRVNYDKIMHALSLFVVLFLGQILGGSNDVSYIYFMTVVFLIGATTIHYMYLNHHPEYAVYITNIEIRAENMINAEEFDEDGEPVEPSANGDNTDDGTNIDVSRARALIFVGENDALYHQIKEEERINRVNNPIAATRIRTEINDEGEYDSVEEELEFYDEPDEQVERVEVHEVKAIPATRPVEIVKPIMADDYYVPEEATSTGNIDAPNLNNMSSPVETAGPVENIAAANLTVEQNNMAADNPPVEDNTPAQPEGFVFRKKESKSEEAPALKAVKEKPGKNEKVDNSNFDDKNAKGGLFKKKDKVPKRVEMELNKDKKSLKDVKPGEPLPNPLKGPKASSKSKESFDFDFDVSDDDDFDF